ncbi:hypothetical protein TNCV_2661661 [Trichonephila clavipes]|nr:hypothetical protein TNCV_2661661 [Trichonephila clavipes]
MTLHSPTENSLAVLNHKILETNSQVQNVKLGGHQTCLSINRLWHELCAVLLEPQLLDIMIVQFRNEKVSNHGSIPITIDCNVVAFIVFEEGFHQPIRRTKQSVFLDVAAEAYGLRSQTPGQSVAGSRPGATEDPSCRGDRCPPSVEAQCLAADVVVRRGRCRPRHLTEV